MARVPVSTHTSRGRSSSSSSSSSSGNDKKSFFVGMCILFFMLGLVGGVIIAITRSKFAAVLTAIFIGLGIMFAVFASKEK
jgi:hypothetical protein